jgi:hypothetical protein
MHPDHLHQLATSRHREAINAAEQYRDRQTARRRARRDRPHPTAQSTRARHQQRPDPSTGGRPRAFRRLWLSTGAWKIADGALFTGLRFSPRKSRTLRG